MPRIYAPTKAQQVQYAPDTKIGNAGVTTTLYLPDPARFRPVEGTGSGSQNVFDPQLGFTPEAKYGKFTTPIYQMYEDIQTGARYRLNPAKASNGFEIGYNQPTTFLEQISGSENPQNLDLTPDQFLQQYRDLKPGEFEQQYAAPFYNQPVTTPKFDPAKGPVVGGQAAGQQGLAYNPVLGGGIALTPQGQAQTPQQAQQQGFQAAPPANLQTRAPGTQVVQGQQQGQQQLGGQSSYTGPSVVDYLSSLGQASDFASRSQLAQQFGIQNYTGTAEQNTRLLDTLRNQQTSSFKPITGGQGAQGTQGGQGTGGAGSLQENPIQSYLSSLGISVNGGAFAANPSQTFSQLYKDIYESTGLGQLKTRIDEVIGRISAADKEFDEQVQKVQDNPWLTQGITDAEIEKARKKYEDKRKNLVNEMNLYEGLYTSGREDARFVAGQTFQQYNADRNYDLNQLKFLADLAEKTAKTEKLDTQVVEVGGRKKIVNLQTGETIADLGVADASSGGLSLFGNEIIGGIPASAYINAFESASLGLPAPARKNATAQFQNLLKQGDEGTLKEYLIRVATETLGSDQQNQALGRAVAIDSMAYIRDLLNSPGISTNLIRGSIENTAQKLGLSSNTDLAYIGNQIAQTLQVYRRAMTGVAFNPGESEEYKKIFPQLTDIGGLAGAKIQSLLDSFERNQRTVLSQQIGASAYNSIFGTTTGGRIQPTNPTQILDSIINGQPQTIEKESGGFFNNFFDGFFKVFGR